MNPQNHSIKAIFSHFVFDKINAAIPNLHQISTDANLTTIDEISVQLRSLQTHAKNIKITNVITLILISVIGCIFGALFYKTQKEKSADTNLNNITLERRNTNLRSYPTSPRQRHEANQTLSSLELITAPSPPPLSLSFAHAQPLFYQDSDESEQDC